MPDYSVTFLLIRDLKSSYVLLMPAQTEVNMKKNNLKSCFLIQRPPWASLLSGWEGQVLFFSGKV